MTPVERMARAICLITRPEADIDYIRSIPVHPLWEASLQQARAALAALREPSETMLSAGDSVMPQIAKGEDITTGYDALKEAWPAMIDAALTESTPADPIPRR